MSVSRASKPRQRSKREALHDTWRKRDHCGVLVPDHQIGQLEHRAGTGGHATPGVTPRPRQRGRLFAPTPAGAHSPGAQHPRPGDDAAEDRSRADPGDLHTVDGRAARHPALRGADHRHGGQSRSTPDPATGPARASDPAARARARAPPPACRAVAVRAGPEPRSRSQETRSNSSVQYRRLAEPLSRGFDALMC
jgi:hypothetical protein